jgi:hypothetical protein
LPVTGVGQAVSESVTEAPGHALKP